MQFWVKLWVQFWVKLWVKFFCWLTLGLNIPHASFAIAGMAQSDGLRESFKMVTNAIRSKFYKGRKRLDDHVRVLRYDLDDLACIPRQPFTRGLQCRLYRCLTGSLSGSVTGSLTASRRSGTNTSNVWLAR